MTGTRTARPWSRCGGRGSREPHQQGGKDHPGTVAGRQLVVSGRHRTKVLAAVHAPFYDVAAGSGPGQLLADARDDGRSDRCALGWCARSGAGATAHGRWGGCSPFSDHVVGALAGPPTAAGPWHTDAVQNRLQLGGFMALARGDHDAQHSAASLGGQVDLGGQPTAGASERLVWFSGRPPLRRLAPAACWWARTIVASMLTCQSSSPTASDSV